MPEFMEPSGVTSNGVQAKKSSNSTIGAYYGAELMDHQGALSSIQKMRTIK
jgi:hypothetical protein